MTTSFAQPSHAGSAASTYSVAGINTSDRELQYREILDNIGVIVLGLDNQGLITLLNSAWTEQLGHPVTGSIGQPLTVFIDPAYASALVQYFQAHQSSVEVQHWEVPFRSTSSAIVSFELSLRAISDGW